MNIKHNPALRAVLDNEHIRLAAMLVLLVAIIVALLIPEHRTWHEQGSRYSHETVRIAPRLR